MLGWVKYGFITLLAFSAAASATQITPVVTSTTAGFPISPDYSADATSPLYTPSGTQTTSPLYQGKDRISPPGSNVVGNPSGSAAGVCFQSVTQPGDPNNGIFVKPAGSNILITITGSNFRDASAAPSINNAGTVVFKSLDASNNQAICSASAGGNIITIVGTSFGQPNGFASFGKPSIDSAGEVAFTASSNSGDHGLFVQAPGSSTIITITGQNFGIDNAQIAGDHIIAHVTNSDGTQEFDGWTRDTATGQFLSVGPLKWMAPEALDMTASLSPDTGDVAVCDGQSLLYFPQNLIWSPKSNTRTSNTDLAILNVGDSLDGSTITQLALSPESWDNQSLTFFAALSNGETGLFTLNVPEPATMSIVLLTAPILLCRRSKWINSPATAVAVA